MGRIGASNYVLKFAFFEISHNFGKLSKFALITFAQYCIVFQGQSYLVQVILS